MPSPPPLTRPGYRDSPASGRARAARARLVAGAPSVLALLVFASGCVAPAMRPMRTVPGTTVMVAGGWMEGGAGEATCGEECTPGPARSLRGPNAEVRYGHMLTSSVGVTGGLYLGGLYLAKSQGLRALALAYGQVSLQSDTSSVALGADFGANVIAPVIGADVQPWGGGGWRPNLALHVRYAQPFVSDAEPEPDGRLIAVASWDTGVVLRLGPIMSQYTYYRQRRGAADVPTGVEESAQARGWHLFLIGVDIPLDRPTVAPSP